MKNPPVSLFRHVSCLALGIFAACTVAENDGEVNGDVGGSTSTNPTSTTTTTGETLTDSGTTSSSTSSSSTGMDDSTTDGDPQGCNYGVVPTTIINDDIKTDTTWSGVVKVNESIKITNNATLTILPGTQIFVDVDRQIEIGWNGAIATVMAMGSAESPIYFCGTVAGAGNWKGLLIETNTTSNSTLSYVHIDGAGMSGPALELNSAIKINEITVSNSADDGVRSNGFANTSAGLSVRNAEGTALVLTNSRAISTLPLGGSFSENLRNAVSLEFSKIDVDAVFRRLDIPYRQVERVDVVGDVSVIFEAGVRYQFSADTDLEFGWNGSHPTVEVQGTTLDPVVFSGVEETAGWWRGLVFGTNVRSNSRLANLQVRDAGGIDSSAMDIAAAIELNELSLTNNAKGIKISEKGLAAASTGISVTGTLSVPMTIESEALISIPQNGSYTGNAQDWIVVQGGSVRQSGTVTAHNVPYRVIGDLDILDGVELSIAPGTQIEMATDTDIEVGWNGGKAGLQAIGTVGQPIVIRGAESSPGFWKGITFRTNALSTTTLEYMEVSDGGNNGFGLLDLHTGIEIKHCTFSNSAGYGIRRKPDDMTDYSTDNTFSMNALGNIGTL